MSNDERRNQGPEPKDVIEGDFTEGESFTPLDQPVCVGGTEPQEGIPGEDLFGAHLHFTAPDRIALIPPMDNLELREDSCKVYRGLNPRDTSEAMMATLAVGLFNATLDAIAYASQRDTPPNVRDTSFRNGMKGATVVADLLERFRAMRGDSQATVRVGKVNVEAGGQAIVGNVQAGRDQAVPDINTSARSLKRKRKRKSA